MSTAIDFEVAAKAALRKLDWRTAAVLFTQAADALPADPHGNVTADEDSLRRSAHLALCRTPEFFAHRERARRLHIWTEQEWKQPSGDLVRTLVVPRVRAVACPL